MFGCALLQKYASGRECGKLEFQHVFYALRGAGFGLVIGLLGYCHFPPMSLRAVAWQSLRVCCGLCVAGSKNKGVFACADWEIRRA